MIKFLDMPEMINMVVFKDGAVFYNLKYKERILKEVIPSEEE